MLSLLRNVGSALGAAMVLVSLAGAVVLVLGPTGPALPALAGLPAPAVGVSRADLAAPTDPRAPARTAPTRPITRLEIDTIQLDTPVVEAPLAEHDGTTTWDVPPQVAGHAEGTPGAGEPGNAVLIGHLTSVHLGNVFLHLDEVQPGAIAAVYSGDQRFDYRVISSLDVDRTDTSVLEPTTKPSLTLITCSGAWLLGAWDYSGRRIVRAELALRK